MKSVALPNVECVKLKTHYGFSEASLFYSSLFSALNSLLHKSSESVSQNQRIMKYISYFGSGKSDCFS